MSLPPQASPPALVTASFRVEANGFEIEARASVPAGPTGVSTLLPIARALSDRIVQETVSAVEAAGAVVSCRAGCAACCRGLVAISEVEARRLAAVVEALPEPHGARVRARFAETGRELERHGLLESLRRPDAWTASGYSALVTALFRLGVACPFLEEESCSIYAERPITCREYLVTSPREHCAELDSRDVRQVRLPVRVFNAVARWETPPPEHLGERVVPLVLALEWAGAHPDEPPARPGPDLLRELLGHLRGSGGG